MDFELETGAISAISSLRMGSLSDTMCVCGCIRARPELSTGRKFAAAAVFSDVVLVETTEMNALMSVRA